MCPIESAPRPPNVVFVLVDDLGWADLGCYGSSYYQTPHLDLLAKRGVRFTQAYAASPVCSPTRAAIMTGKHPARLNITDWIPGSAPNDRRLLGPDDLHALPLTETTLAEAFFAHGYRTFYGGKWHLGGEGHYPEDQGFEVNRGGHHAGSPPGGYYSPYHNPKLEDGPEGEYLPDRLTDECIAFLEANQEMPILAFLAYYTVHTPIQASRRHLAACEARANRLSPEATAPRPERDALTRTRQDNPDYASMVEAMDENVGRLINAIDRLGLSENTILVFTSDNGGLSTLPATRGELAPTANGPLRAGKGWCYEGGIRVPLLVAGPGLAVRGAECHEPVTSMDFFSTLLEWTGHPQLPEQHVDGVSFLPLLRGERAPERPPLFWHYPHYHGSAWRPGAAVRAGDWKYIVFYDEETEELYNLRDDPGETQDLAQQFTERAAGMRSLLERRQAECGARMPTPNPAFKAPGAP